MVNSILSSLILQEFYKDHKRTWQEVSNVFLHYIYYYYKFCSKLYMLSISLLYYYYKINML